MSCVDMVLNRRSPHVVFTARGHPNITAKNRRTIEITKDIYVTKRGDCIVACCSERAAGELGEISQYLTKPGKVVIVIDAGVVQDYVVGSTPLAIPTSMWRIVARKSTYVDDSTVAISIEKAAADLKRELLTALRRGAPVRITIGVCPSGYVSP